MPRRLLLCPGSFSGATASAAAGEGRNLSWSGPSSPGSQLLEKGDAEDLWEAAAETPMVQETSEEPKSDTPSRLVPTPARSQKRRLVVTPATEALAPAEETPHTPDACYKVNFTKEAQKKRKTFRCGFLRVKAGKAYLYDDEGRHVMLGRSTRIDGVLQPGAQISPTWETLVEVEEAMPLEELDSGRAFAASAPAPKTEAAPKMKRKAPRTGPGPREDYSPLIAPQGSLILDEGAGEIFLEPSLAGHLKPHQEEGVKFMMRHLLQDTGCILADSMGLGKTLQALCTLWVAFSKPLGRPLCRKAAVVCPSSLCANWASEVAQWLGPQRLKPAVVQGGGSPGEAIRTISSFVSSPEKLLIISYDQLRIHADALDGVLELLVCDEGHRLKSGCATTTKKLQAMRCRRRILISGTPLQNNLDEFYTCCQFVHPPMLPVFSVFQRVFKHAIERARDKNASAEELALGKAREAELRRATSAFILRRGPEILEELLPTRTELLLTVHLTQRQVLAYRGILQLRTGTQHGDGVHLQLLMLLRQLCNDPQGLRSALERRAGSHAGVGVKKTDFSTVREMEHPGDAKEPALPVAPDFDARCRQVLEGAYAADAMSGASAPDGAQEATSAKLRLLQELLGWLKVEAPSDGVVIVSNFCSMQSSCGTLCERLGFAVFVLDGSTAVAKRLDLVSRFNRLSNPRVFLLSAKAGGVGLNIIGANRLILLEPDWNPAVDQQAMGRVWRQGQEKPVFIYRLATHGTLEEKILQRQAHKQGPAYALVEENEGALSCKSDTKELYKVYDLDGYTPDGRVGARAEAAALFIPKGLPEAWRLPSLHRAELLKTTDAALRQRYLGEEPSVGSTPLFLQYG